MRGWMALGMIMLAGGGFAALAQQSGQLQGFPSDPRIVEMTAAEPPEEAERALWVWILDERGNLRLCRGEPDVDSAPRCSPPANLR